MSTLVHHPDRCPTRFVWKNVFTGHWMLSRHPKPADGHTRPWMKTEGFLRWDDAVREAHRQTEPQLKAALRTLALIRREQHDMASGVSG